MATDRVTVDLRVRYVPPRALQVEAALADVRSYVREASDRLRADLGLPLRYPAMVRVSVWDEEVAAAPRRVRSWRDEPSSATVFELPRAAVERALAGVYPARSRRDPSFAEYLALMRQDMRLAMQVQSPASFTGITSVT